MIFGWLIFGLFILILVFGLYLLLSLDTNYPDTIETLIFKKRFELASKQFLQFGQSFSPLSKQVANINKAMAKFNRRLSTGRN